MLVAWRVVLLRRGEHLRTSLYLRTTEEKVIDRAELCPRAGVCPRMSSTFHDVFLYLIQQTHKYNSTDKLRPGD